jgi:hypothetical protein
MTTQELKNFVWKYFGFIKAKDGPATKTNLDITKDIYELCQKSYANKEEHPFNIIICFILE